MLVEQSRRHLVLPARLVVAMMVCCAAAPNVVAQEKETEDAHNFLQQALPRGGASYGGTSISEYHGEGCSSVLSFGDTKLSVDWTQVTDVSWKLVLGGGHDLKLVGRYDGGTSIETRKIAIESSDLASRAVAAAASLRRSCDPLKASGF